MPRRATWTILIALLGLSIAAYGVPGAPFGGSSFEIDWWTVDSGGGTSSGGAFELSGTIGQHDASGPMTGGGFSVTGGYWTAQPGGALCPADLDGDDQVAVGDLLLLLSAWGACGDPCVGDLDGDAQVAVSDLLVLLAAWGPCNV